MKGYLISFDLNKPGQDYATLGNRLNAHGAIKVLYSQYALKTSWTAVQLRDDLMAFIDANDRLLVTEIGNWAGVNLMASDKFKQIAA